MSTRSITLPSIDPGWFIENSFDSSSANLLKNFAIIVVCSIYLLRNCLSRHRYFELSVLTCNIFVVCLILLLSFCLLSGLFLYMPCFSGLFLYMPYFWNFGKILYFGKFAILRQKFILAEATRFFRKLDKTWIYDGKWYAMDMQRICYGKGYTMDMQRICDGKSD